MDSNRSNPSRVNGLLLIELLTEFHWRHIQSNSLCIQQVGYGESFVCHDRVSRFKKVQQATLDSQVSIRNTTNIKLRNQRYCSWWSNTYHGLESVVILVGAEGELLSCWTWWLLNEYFCGINHTSCCWVFLFEASGHCGITCCLDGHMLTSLNFECHRLFQVLHTRDTVDCEIPERKARSCSSKARRSRQSTRKNSFRGVSTLGARTFWIWLLLTITAIPVLQITNTFPKKVKTYHQSVCKNESAFYLWWSVPRKTTCNRLTSLEQLVMC